jgi:hypothetical protein
MRNEDLEIMLKAQFSAVRAMIDANATIHKHDLEQIVEQNKIRNSRIEKVECETSFWRWAQRNKTFFIPLTIIAIIGLIVLVVRFGPEIIIKYLV